MNENEGTSSHNPGDAGQPAATMTVRKMPFEFPDEIDAHWNKGKPEWSHMVSGASLAMPYLEPYLIRTMRKAYQKIRSEVNDPQWCLDWIKTHENDEARLAVLDTDNLQASFA